MEEERGREREWKRRMEGERDGGKKGRKREGDINGGRERKREGVGEEEEDGGREGEGE